MPRLILRVPDHIDDELISDLLDTLEAKLAEEFKVEIPQIGSFVNRYDKLSRPCEAVSLTVVGVDLPGRAERLQSIADKAGERHGWIEHLRRRGEKAIDLDFDRRAAEDWVAA